MSVIPMTELLPAIVKILKPETEYKTDRKILKVARAESVHYGISSEKPYSIRRIDNAWQVTLSVHDTTEHGCLAKWEIKEPTMPNDQCRYKIVLDLPSLKTIVYEDEDMGMQTEEFELQDLQPGCWYRMRIRVIHRFQVGELTWSCVLAQQMLSLKTKKASRKQGAKPQHNKRRMRRDETKEWTRANSEKNDDHKRRKKWRKCSKGGREEDQ